jgi:hypothetical protein
MKAFDASRPDSVAQPVSTAATSKPAAPKPAETPLISDDMMGSFMKKPAFDPMATQKMPSGADQTQKMPTGADQTQKMPGVDRTQRMDVPAAPETTQRMDAAKTPESTQPIANRPKAPELPREVKDDRTIQTRRLDPAFKPEATQKLDLDAPASPAPPGDLNPEATQRLDDSIWRLEEAKRILKGVKEKN